MTIERYLFAIIVLIIIYIDNIVKFRFSVNPAKVYRKNSIKTGFM